MPNNFLRPETARLESRSVLTVALLAAAFCAFFWFGYWTAARTAPMAPGFSRASTPELTPTSPELPRLKRL